MLADAVQQRGMAGRVGDIESAGQDGHAGEVIRRRQAVALQIEGQRGQRVGRQVVVFVAREGLEKAPGAPGRRTEQDLVGRVGEVAEEPLFDPKGERIRA